MLDAKKVETLLELQATLPKEGLFHYLTDANMLIEQDIKKATANKTYLSQCANMFPELAREYLWMKTALEHIKREETIRVHPMTGGGDRDNESADPSALRKWLLHWKDGKEETVTGYDLAGAMRSHGYGRGALGALDYWEDVP